jgi:hypothetical protein
MQRPFSIGFHAFAMGLQLKMTAKRSADCEIMTNAILEIMKSLDFVAGRNTRK